MDQLLNITPAAVSQLKELVAAETEKQIVGLRVFVSGGGCSGFQYGFAFVESVDEGDMVIEAEGVKVLVDPISFQYLAGAQIDYINGLQGSRFTIKNPNATTTCGCGSSFSA